jgi:thiol-disulfide isomerase/thioredoxin
MRWAQIWRWSGLAGAAALAAALAGCGGSSPVQPTERTSPAGSSTAAERAEPPATTPAADADVTLMEGDAAALERLLSQHAGKVVLVDFWATWCVPCKQGLPKILALGAEHGRDNLAVISVSLDDPSQSEEVRAFLRSVGATIPNVISTWGAGTESMERFGIVGGLPYYRLYDRRGQMRFQFAGDPAGLSDVDPLDQLPARLIELLGE